MNLGRTILSLFLALSLAACGGDDSGGGGGVGNAGSCSLSARQDWALGVLQEWYLFPELLATNVNKADHATLDSYIDALVAPARAQNKDRFFTYVTSIREENDLIQNGSNAGFGILLSYDTASNRVFVAEAYETAPAYLGGFDRGTEILQINGQSVSTLMATGGRDAVVSALGPPDPGITRQFVIRSAGGVTTNPTVTKAEYPLDPISDRYGVRILDNGTSGRVGYINLRTFIIADAADQLRTAFQQFRSQGVTHVILDLRYNGGGLVSVADLLGDLMGENLVNQVFSRTVLRPSKAAENSTKLFQNEPNQIVTMKLAVIGRGGTASASELVTNSMIPWLGNNIALVGADTYGKPVGQFAFDRSACDDRLRAVAFKTVNANGQGEYFDGLASVMPNTCSAGDDLATQLGDPNEASIKVALDFLGGRSCTPISVSRSNGAISQRGGTMQTLEPSGSRSVGPQGPGVY